MADARIVLRSPFNGGTFVVPPESPPEFVVALIAAGFTRASDPEPVKPKTTYRKDTT